MFKKLMASFGQGGAKVDLVLQQNQFYLGDQVEGKIIIYGGTVAQQINRIGVSLEMDVRVSGRHYTRTVAQVPFHSSFTIQPHEQKELPFQFVLPNNLLISGNYVSFYFKTHLDIAGGVDHTDKDYISVLPTPELQNVLHALEQLGFREKHDSRKFNGYAQEFELFPTQLYQGQIEEIEFIIALQEDGIRMLFEVDIYSFGHKREVKRELFLDHSLLTNVPNLANYFKQLLDELLAQQSAFGQQPTFGQQSSPYPQNPYSQNPYPQRPQRYFGSSSARHYGHHPHHKHRGFSSGAAGAVGGFAAGMLGGMLINEMMDDDDDGGFGGGFDDEGGFDDFFGGDED
ncbi:sporulation protein [Hazenella coriacea]|uniref:Sporulation-control protein n=1 Tax=Hazenella coriacea TaxID=1179467 RepID=A0A4R3L7U3_9BACL|nr:sporulation protein [Hazenella coriacea]TCS95105.1 sporulation-control protein [Hazenella coriacea]